eukprot:4831752-Pleurochrysis_carterae.AAC.1
MVHGIYTRGLTRVHTFIRSDTACACAHTPGRSIASVPGLMRCYARTARPLSAAVDPQRTRRLVNR